LITFDAKAEFSAFELSPLPVALTLVDVGKAGTTSGPMTVEQARLEVVAAEKALAAAEAQPLSLKARVAAERARLQTPPSADAKELARKAFLAEKQAAVIAAEESVARAEAEVASNKPGAAAKMTAGRTALTQARKALENPGEVYTPIRGSLKTLESNLETEASRS